MSHVGMEELLYFIFCTLVNKYVFFKDTMIK
jgi:hypothetical protein